MTSTEAIGRVGDVLNDPAQSLPARFRALFTLRNLRGEASIKAISRCFRDESALLKHECAYCLGQMQDTAAAAVLRGVLADAQQQPIVRHEAGEALGALGVQENLDILLQYSTDVETAVAETCQLAVCRLRWLLSGESATLPPTPYTSVDPAPPAPGGDVDAHKRALLDTQRAMFARYRAMFALRNLGGSEAALALAAGLRCASSALFRHEVAYVLGQLREAAAVPQLVASLADCDEAPMVRHEAAEALGAIASDACRDALTRHRDAPDAVVRDSCRVALDMLAHEVAAATQFQYADTLAHVSAGC